MTLKLSRIVAGIALCLTAACGAPGSFELCNATCDAYRKCGYANDVQTTNCHTDCTNNKGTYSDQDAQLNRDCKNAGDIRNQENNCLNSTPCGGSVAQYSLTLGTCESAAGATANCIK